MTSQRKPRIVLTRKARLMMRYAVEERPNHEVQGFGAVELDDNGSLYVTDIIIPPHEVTSSTVDLTAEVLTNFMLELSEQGKVLSDYPLWWHSHAGMSTGPSGQDDETLQALAKEMGGVAFGIVTNKREEFTGWYFVQAQTDYGWFPVEGKMDVYVETEPRDKRLSKAVREMMERVTIKAPPAPVKTTSVPGNSGYGKAHVHPGQSITCWCKNPPSESVGDKNGAIQREPVTADVDDEEENRILGYYAWLQAQLPPGHTAKDMALRDFVDYYEDNMGGEDGTLVLPFGEMPLMG